MAKCGNMTDSLKLLPENCMPGTLIAMHVSVDHFCKLVYIIEYYSYWYFYS